MEVVMDMDLLVMLDIILKMEMYSFLIVSKILIRSGR